MLSERTWAVSAKFDEGRYHPLICHMLDVAAVVEAMWDTRLSQSEQALLAIGLGLPLDDARRWVAFVAGLHDLGKASRPFQAKDINAGNRLGAVGLSPSTKTDPGHGTVSTAVLPDLLVSLGVERFLAYRLATVAGGHHGRFLQRPTSLPFAIDEEAVPTRHAWEAIRDELFRALADLLGIGEPASGGLPNAAAMLMAGIISVCDWIGSSTDYFDFCEKRPVTLEAYLDGAREQARRALNAIHWTALTPDATRPGMKELFGENRPARPLQQLAEQFEPVAEPGLVIVEAPTGEGKTEAALLFADRWNAAGFAGQYVALPTQATANQMYDRVNAYLRRRYRGEQVTDMLAHGGAWLNDDIVVLPSGVSGDDSEANVAAAEWFLNRKRTLLAPFGVGTIDQALFAVLQVKHVFVRLFGLAGKVVILDEVHAYDTYMTGLIERLLEWLGALGSPVVLLSATLPSSRRQVLIDAYNAGLHSAKQASLELDEADYPRVTMLTGGKVVAQTVQASARSVRTLGIDALADDEQHFRVADLLERELSEGGCAAVICNTVSRVQQMYLALKEHFPGEVSLFHARFVADDRQRIEGECLSRFGPDAATRPKKHVLVATQVIEQSLDLDFDVMVTDLAPVDLLLQRAGRLQRHERGHRKQPVTLHVICPQEGAHDVPQFDPGSAAVYDPHILLRTWWELRGRDAIAVPDEVQELVDMVYTDSGVAPEGMTGELAGFWAKTWADLAKRKAEDEEQAKVRRLRPPWNCGALTEFTKDPREEDAPDLHPAAQALTRLASPSIQLVILESDDPALGDKAKPKRAEVRRLLGRSVTVSQRGLVHALSAMAPPRPWADVPALHRHRLLATHANVAGYSLRYGPDLGLEIETKGRP